MTNNSPFRRNNTEYNYLLHKWDDAVENIWPGANAIPLHDLENSCTSLSDKPEHLKAIVISSYRLMKLIRTFLHKKKLSYTEGHKYPNLATALENAFYATTCGNGALADEASELECVSRAAYHWLKVMKKLGRTPTAVELEAAKPKPPRGGFKFCMCCKTEPATDDTELLCDECSGAGDVLETIMENSQPAMDRGSTCAVCQEPRRPGSYYCATCDTVEDMGKQTTIVEKKPRRHFIGMTWENCPGSNCLICGTVTATATPRPGFDTGSSVMTTPFDHINSEFPLPHAGINIDWGDMMMPNRAR